MAKTTKKSAVVTKGIFNNEQFNWIRMMMLAVVFLELAIIGVTLYFQVQANSLPIINSTCFRKEKVEVTPSPASGTVAPRVSPQARK